MTQLAVDLEALLERLRTRYTRPEIPPCRICDQPLSEIEPDTDAGPRFVRYACDCRGVAGEDWAEHYTSSIWTQHRVDDPDVLDLLDLIAGTTAVEWGVRADWGDTWLLDEGETRQFAALLSATAIRRINLHGPATIAPEAVHA